REGTQRAKALDGELITMTVLAHGKILVCDEFARITCIGLGTSSVPYEGALRGLCILCALCVKSGFHRRIGPVVTPRRSSRAARAGRRGVPPRPPAATSGAGER